MIIIFLSFQISTTQSYYTLSNTQTSITLNITDNQRLFSSGQTITGYLNYYVNLSSGTNTINANTVTRLFFTTSYSQVMQVTLTAQNYNLNNQPGTNFIPTFNNLLGALSIQGYYTTLDLIVTPNYIVTLRNQQVLSTTSTLTYTLQSSGIVGNSQLTLTTAFAGATTIPTSVLLMVNCTDIPVTTTQGIQAGTGVFQFIFDTYIAKSIQNYQECGFLLFDSTSSTGLSMINMNVGLQFPAARSTPMLYEYIQNTADIVINLASNIQESTISVTYNDQLGILSQYIGINSTLILTDNRQSFQFTVQNPVTSILQIQYSKQNFAQLNIQTFDNAITQINKGNSSLALILQTSAGLIVPLTGEFRYKRDFISILQASQNVYNNVQLNVSYSSRGITFLSEFQCAGVLTLHFYGKDQNSTTAGFNQPFWSFNITLPQSTCQQQGTMQISLEQLRSTNMSAYYLFVNSPRIFYTFKIQNGPQVTQYSSTFTYSDTYTQVNTTVIVVSVIFALIALVLIILLILWLLGIIGNKPYIACDCCVGCCRHTQKLTRSKMVMSMRPKGIQKSLRKYELRVK